MSVLSEHDIKTHILQLPISRKINDVVGLVIDMLLIFYKPLCNLQCSANKEALSIVSKQI